MSLFNLHQPRRFSFQPRNSQGSERTKISFRRATSYDPHANSRLPLRSFIILVLIGLLILIIGGVKPHFRTPIIKSGDAVSQPIETKSQ
ncbi:hypothetical protein K9N50_08725 [bacterium]|nr:hypothetical protein [bacterium]